MVLVVHPADAAHVVDRRFVVQMADQCVAGVGGNGQHAPFFQQGHGLFEKSGLRVIGVNFKELRHGFAVGRYKIRSASNSHTGVNPPSR